jgi:hypothetical protein
MGMRGNIMHINNLLGVDQEQWDSLHMITGIGRSGNIIGYICIYIYYIYMGICGDISYGKSAEAINWGCKSGSITSISGDFLKLGYP